MSPKGRGRGRRKKGRSPIRGRGKCEVEESLPRERSIIRTDAAAPPQAVSQVAPPPAALAAGIDPTTTPPQAVAPQAAPPPAAPTIGIYLTTNMMWESFQAMMHAMMVTQQANNSRSTSAVDWLDDFKEFDPRPFTGFTRDPTEAQMWILSIETIFLSMECPDNHKVLCASFMLQQDAELWWMDNKNSINPEGGIMTWDRFKEAFLKQYSKAARLKTQQKFNFLTQGGHSVDQYDSEFMRLKRFAPSLVDTEEKMTEKFVLGLDLEIRRIVEVIDPKTYEEALRIAKVLEKPQEERRREPAVTIGRKCPYEPRQTDYRQLARRTRYDDRRPAQHVDRHPRDRERGQRREKPQCCECGKEHWGKCMAGSRICFRCGYEGHTIKYCIGRVPRIQ